MKHWMTQLQGGGWLCWATQLNRRTGNQQIGHAWVYVVDDFGTLVPVRRHKGEVRL